MSYTRFANVMATSYPDYNWEPLQVTTSDDYILTLFHVWSEDKRDKSKGPILFQHGGGQDGTDMLRQFGMTEWYPGPAMQIQYADLGHDIYIGNNRGTEYSLGHTQMDSPADDPTTYWDFSLEGLAQDVLANSKAMYQNADAGQGYYIGYSQGTIQAYVAMAKYESELQVYLNRVILFAPCTGQSSAEAVDSMPKSKQANYVSGHLSDIGIYAVNEATWDADKKKICKELPDDVCQWAQYQYGSGSLKLTDHWAQCAQSDRFQEYVDDWSYPDTIEGTLYPLDQISQIPVSMYVAEYDGVCILENSVETSKQIPTLQNFYTIKGEGHGFFGSNKKDFVDLVAKELTTDTVDTPNRVEVQLEGGKDWWTAEDQAEYEAWLAETGREGTLEDWYDFMDQREGNGRNGLFAWNDAQTTFLSVAVGAAVESALQLFRYRSAESYYDGFDYIGEKNYWKYSNFVAQYSALSLFGIAAFTQLLANFGVAQNLNMWVWLVGVFGIGGVATTVSGVLSALAYDAAYRVSVGEDSSDVQLAAAAAIMETIAIDTVTLTVEGYIMEQVLSEARPAWMLASYSGSGNGKGDDDKDGDWGDKDGDWGDKDGDWGDKDGDWGDK